MSSGLYPGHDADTRTTNSSHASGGKTSSRRPERRRLLFLLAGALALDAADKGALGAVAVGVKTAFGVGNTQLGLLATVVSACSALATIPAGVLADRTRRTRLLGLAVLTWAVAAVASGLAPSYLILLGSRVGLSIGAAVAAPCAASIVGDLVDAPDRSRVYSYLLTGELVGTGVGLIAAGEIAAVLSWRWAFAALALPAVALGLAILAEPEPGRRRAQHEQEQSWSEANEARAAPASPSPVDNHRGPRAFLSAIRYVLSVRTNVILIVASTLGYFFFAGIRTFALVLTRHRFHLGQATATSLVAVIGVGSLFGLIAGGHLTDRLRQRGWLDARILVAAGCLMLGATLVLPGLFVPRLATALALFVLAAAALAAVNPAIDAARLDVIDPGVWGRAEAVRTIFRAGGETAAPVLFGLTADHLAGGGTAGLQWAFAIGAALLALNGVVLLLARTSYVTDSCVAGQLEGHDPRSGHPTPARSSRPPSRGRADAAEQR